MKVLLWSPLLSVDDDSETKSNSSHCEISNDLLAFSRLYMKRRNINPRAPEAIIAMVIIRGVSSESNVSQEAFTSIFSETNGATYISVHTCS